MKRQAFTLIELIVTISIVSVLAALIIPAVNRSLEKGRAAKCVGNLRQVGTAFQLYLQDNQYRMPQRVYPIPYGDGGKYGYDEMLLPYVNNTTGIFQCPSQSSKNYPAEPSYGMNWYYDNQIVIGLERPARVILATDTRGNFGTGSHRADRDSESPGQLASDRHSGKANFLFFDGHVETLTHAETLAPDDLWGTDSGQHEEEIEQPAADS